jgi:hypothetical protein
MRYIFVGDAQERLSIVEPVLKLGNKETTIVFLGDIADSWRESDEAHAQAIEKVLNSPFAKYIAANHEWSYLDTSMRCSGYRPGLNQLLLNRGLSKRLLKEMIPYFWLKDHKILATHAGIHLGVWNTLFPTQEKFDIKKLSECYKEGPTYGNPYFAIGRVRGGSMRFGGPLWCDWIEEFVPVPGITQIVGHTSRLGVPKNFPETKVGAMRQSPNGDWCIDCLSRTPQVLVLDFSQNIPTFSVLDIAEAKAI